MKESGILKSILLTIGQKVPHARLFRNNTGMGWQGAQLESRPGTVLLSNPRPLDAGLCKGSSDLIGWTTVEITPEMVGKKVAVFTAIEVKQPGNKPTAEQANFLERVRMAGGIGFVATNPEKSAGDLKILAENLGR